MGKDSHEYTSFLDILHFLFLNLKSIILITFVFFLLSIIYVFIVDEKFTIVCKLKPSEVTYENSILKNLSSNSFSLKRKESEISREIRLSFTSLDFLEQLYIKYKDNKIVFEDLNEEVTSEGKFYYAVKRLKDIFNMSINKEDEVIILSLELKDKDLAFKILNETIVMLRDYINIKNKIILFDDITYYNLMLDSVKNPRIIEDLKTIIAEKIKKRALLTKNIFSIIESPRIPFKKSFPKRILLISISTITGFFFSILFLILVKKVKYLKDEFNKIISYHKI